MNEKEFECTTGILDDSYKNVRMASFAIDCIIEAIEDNELKNLLRKQNKFYLSKVREIEDQSKQYNHKLSDINMFLKGSSFASIKMKTMMDNSTSTIAQMLVEGTTMGITTSIKAKRDFECAEKNILSLANDIISSEEKFVESLKDFL